MGIKYNHAGKRRETGWEPVPSVQSPRKCTQSWTRAFWLQEKGTDPNSRDSMQNTCQLCRNHWQVATVVSASPNVPLSWKQGIMASLVPLWLGEAMWPFWPMTREQKQVRLKHLIAGMRPSRGLSPSALSSIQGGSVSWVPEWGQCRAESLG